MFGIGGFELFLILIFGFLIFGPDKLPDIAKTIGKFINRFRTSSQEMSETLKTGFFDKDSDEPFKNPVETMEKVKKTEESFSERKARYDKERAEAKKAAEKKAAEQSQKVADQPSKTDAEPEFDPVAAWAGETDPLTAVPSSPLDPPKPSISEARDPIEDSDAERAGTTAPASEKAV